MSAGRRSAGKSAGSDFPAKSRSSRAQSSGTVVAVLEKRGRFWAAEPQFQSERSDAGGRHSHGGRRLTLGSNRVVGAHGGTARTGDLVLVQLPGRNGDGRATIARVLGRPDVARDLIEGLLLDRGLSRRFEQGVEREARAAGEQTMQATAGRRDLTGLPTFTIDPASARDFDDAISAEYMESDPAHTDPTGSDPTRPVRVWVHIADVSAYVPEGSLVPGAARAAVTVELELRGASVVKAAFYRSLIRSDERLSYERVDEIFAGRERAQAPWGEPLKAAREVAAALEQARRKGHSGALTLDSTEPEFSFDEDGHVSEVRVRVQTESHRVIEHLMIAANEAVARLLSERGTPCLYRVHARPEPERVKRLVEQLSSLEVPTPPVPKTTAVSPTRTSPA